MRPTLPHTPRRIWLRRLCAGIGLLFLARPLLAAPGPSELRVGVSPIFPPMIFKQGKELAGVEVDLARALGEQLGRRVVFVEVPWKDQMEALSTRRTDIIMSSMSITLARRQVMDFSNPYLLTGQMALVRREDRGQYVLGFPMTLPGKAGVLKATTGEFLLQRDFPKATRKTYDTSDEAARALIKGKVDLFISDSTLVWYLAGLHANEGLTVVPINLTEEHLGWAVRKGDTELLTSVNAFITKASADGTFNRIGRRWMAVGP